MANWFKIYETDLDETHLRYAMSSLPEVWPVWTGVLMECCKHRSDTFRWGKDEQELFGFSDRLKISIPKVNEAIRLLVSISYITISDGQLKVLKWNEKQDDYLARKSRGYWEKRREITKLTVNHSESHIEERRGEEIRGEYTKQQRASDFPEANGTPTKKEVLARASMVGLAEWKAADWFSEMEACGWKDHNNRVVVRWQALMDRVRTKWESDGRPSGPPKPTKGVEQKPAYLRELERETKRILNEQT